MDSVKHASESSMYFVRYVCVCARTLMHARTHTHNANLEDLTTFC